jgi:multiple sugar transport system substrate-binding protein
MSDSVFAQPFSRRTALQLGLGAAALPFLASCSGASTSGGGDFTFLSTQFTPVEEKQRFEKILADHVKDVKVSYNSMAVGDFTTQVKTQVSAGKVGIGMVGGLHGDLAPLADNLEDVSDLAGEMSGAGIPGELWDLSKLGGGQNKYIPWMQATYVMAANRSALAYLPEGVDEAALQTSLTYEQLTQWIMAINEAEGPKFGLPCGEMGLYHRFLQGYAYPSFTGGLNTTFTSDAAVGMWQWLQDAWQYANPQSVNYDNLSDPLLTGEISVGWDHTARLINALRENPDNLIAFPAPRGPEGLGFLPVVAGLAIPNTSPNPDGARALIEYLTRPEVQAVTLQQVAFFPVVAGELPEDLGAGVQAEVAAVQATTSDPAALQSLLPVGLGEQGGAYNDVFKATFRAIVLDGSDDIPGVLAEQAGNLQAVLDTAGAACWTPDPASEGVCQVGSGAMATPVS